MPSARRPLLWPHQHQAVLFALVLFFSNKRAFCLFSPFPRASFMSLFLFVTAAFEASKNKKWRSRARPRLVSSVCLSACARLPPLPLPAAAPRTHLVHVTHTWQQCNDALLPDAATGGGGDCRAEQSSDGRWRGVRGGCSSGAIRPRSAPPHGHGYDTQIHALIARLIMCSRQRFRRPSAASLAAVASHAAVASVAQRSPADDRLRTGLRVC